jgi:hypothetical protein
MEFYSATKNEILSFAGKWMELENIILSGLSCSEGQKSHVLLYTRIINKKNAVILLDMGHTLRGDYTREG